MKCHVATKGSRYCAVDRSMGRMSAALATIGGQSLGWEGSVGGSGSDGVKVGTVSIGMVDEVEVEVVDVVSSLWVVVGP